MFVVLESNPALKVIYMTLAYENDENGIIVCIPTLSARGREWGWSSYQIFKKGREGLTRSQFLEGVAVKEGGEFL